MTKAKREGRPPKSYSTRRIVANIPLELYERLHRRAVHDSRTLTKVLELALGAYLKGRGRTAR